MIQRELKLLYRSVIRDGKFIVLVTDGIFNAPIMELPTEEYADKVAFELQSAWDEGVLWGSLQKQKELNVGGCDKYVSEVIQELKRLNPAEREAYHKRVNRRNERVQKVDIARRWKNVLSWKISNNE